MMKIDDIVNGTDAYRSELCKQVQNDSGVECIMLEKDLWVTYVLEKIFADKELSRILRFKGGTSLSKAHRIIRRFSEDVERNVARRTRKFRRSIFASRSSSNANCPIINTDRWCSRESIIDIGFYLPPEIC